MALAMSLREIPELCLGGAPLTVGDTAGIQALRENQCCLPLSLAEDSSPVAPTAAATITIRL